MAFFLQNENYCSKEIKLQRVPFAGDFFCRLKDISDIMEVSEIAFLLSRSVEIISNKSFERQGLEWDTQ